ncbi:MAG: nitrate reductase molybdenum cofactor assembly chaperone [Candidatus Dormibacterales bacterium]
MRALRRERRARPPFLLLSLLLQYPDERLTAALDRVREAVAALPASYEKVRLERFAARLEAVPPARLRAEYVETFDLEKRCGLYLSYFVHGDTRKRGMALLRLKRLYTAAGLVKDDGELPDYLPLMLEFAGLAPDGYGERILAEHRLPLELVRRALHGRRSPYADLLDAVCHGLPALSPVEQLDLGRLVAGGPPTEEVGLEPFAPPEVMPSPVR